MKTTTALSRLITVEIDHIAALDNEKQGGRSREAWALREKEIRKARGKHTDQIRRLRRLILFVERTSEEGVRQMYDKVSKEVAAATATANRMFAERNSAKRLIWEYLTAVGVPLKKKQIRELEFLLNSHE